MSYMQDKATAAWEWWKLRFQTIAIVATVLGTVGIFVEPHMRHGLQAWLGIHEFEDRFAANCISFPDTGHTIERRNGGGTSIPLRDTALVTLVGVKKIADCGVPDVTGVIVNGKGISHTFDLAPLMFELGENGPTRFSFNLPAGMEPGGAAFRIIHDYPQRGRTARSPRIFFTLTPEQPKPDYE